MNIGLTFLAQVRDAYAQKSFRQMIMAIVAGYNRQHNDDDTHGTITASGSISERSRATAMGDWTSVPWSAVTFSGSGSMTWSTVSTNLTGIGIGYTLLGSTMLLAWSFVGTSVKGTANTNLTFKISNTISPVSITYGTFHYNNNGTFGIGRCSVAPLAAGMQGLTVTLNIVSLGNWALSTQNTDTSGQFAFEVTGV